MSQQATQFDLTTSEGVLAYLAPTPFASTRAEPLSGGSANFIFRLYLNAPYEGRSTLVLKHARPYAAKAPGFLLPISRQEFEVAALRHIRAFSESSQPLPLPLPLPLPSSQPQPTLHDDHDHDHDHDSQAPVPSARSGSRVLVSVPAVHHFDNAPPDKAAVIIMDDAGPRSLTLKAALLAGRVPLGRAEALGSALGSFLRALHARGRRAADKDKDADGHALREVLAGNAWGREISAWATYGRLVGATLRALDGDGGAGVDARDRERLVSVLGDEPLGVPEETLRVVEALAERRATQIKEGEGDAFLMGDFWPGNVLVGGGEDEEGEGEGEEGGPRALVVDWELAKVGLAGFDVGQFCAELATVRRLSPERAAAAGEVLQGFVRAYFAGDVGREADETRRVALGHFGVHLAVWTPRTGWGGGAGPTRALMLYGVAQLVESADASKIWTDEELIQKFLS